MSTINIYNMDNMKFETKEESVDLIYSDVIYESFDFSHAEKYWKYLKPNKVFIVQTDYHTSCEWGVFLKTLPDAVYLNHIVWKCEWGNHPKDRFHQCFDDIFIFTKGKNHNFYPDKIQVPKATANTKLNPSGRMTKTATAWIDDIVLTTTAKERVKKDDGHLVRWQKPVRLFDRIISPFVNKGDYIIDNFMGSGSLCEWSLKNDINYCGIEYDKSIYKLAKKRIEKIKRGKN